MTSAIFDEPSLRQFGAQPFAGAATAYWQNGGNANGVPGTLGTTDAEPLSLFAGGSTKVFLTSNAAGTLTTLGIAAAVVAAAALALQAGSGGIGVGVAPPGSSGVTLDATASGGTATIGGAVAPNASSVIIGAAQNGSVNINSAGSLTGLVTNIGSTNVGSALQLRGGNSSNFWDIAAGGTLALGTNGTDHTVNIGSISGASPFSLRAGTGGIGLGVAAPGTSVLAMDTPGAGAALLIVPSGGIAGTVQIGGNGTNSLTSITARINTGGLIAIQDIAQAAAISIGTGNAIMTINIGTNNTPVNVIQIGGTASTLGFYGKLAVVQAARSGQITAIAGAPGTTMPTVGGAFNQANIDNNFATCATKINNLETIIHNVGLSA